jgi:hypothetical protein
LVVRGEALVRPDSWSRPATASIEVGYDEIYDVDLVGLPTAPFPGEILAESADEDEAVQLVPRGTDEGVRFESSKRNLTVVSRWMFSAIADASVRFVALDDEPNAFIYGEVTAISSDALDFDDLQRHCVTWRVPEIVAGRVRVVVGVQYYTGWGVEEHFDVYRGWVDIPSAADLPATSVSGSSELEDAGSER